MSKYSLGGYRIALRSRSSRTLMVEGESDKLVIQRLLLEVEGLGPKPSVDTPELLGDPVLNGLGNKAKVELITSQLGSGQSFLGLVDREWESFDSDELAHVGVEEGLGEKGGLLKTFGHSIENYFFEELHFTTLLRRSFAAHLQNGALRLIQEQFVNMCSLALAFSLSARDLGIITRCSGMVSRRHLHIDDTGVYLRTELRELLELRGISKEVGDQFLSRVSNYQERILLKAIPHDTLKWAMHGHLGVDLLWCCISRVIEEVGGNTAACDQIERGMVSEKLKHGADLLASSAHEVRPLDWIVRWLYGLEDSSAANEVAA